jgi:hypothetical protein
MYINLPIKTKEKCLATQRCLFAMGYKWMTGSTTLFCPSVSLDYNLGISITHKYIGSGQFTTSTPLITLPETFIIPEQYWGDE